MTEKKGAIPSEVVEKSATLHTASFTPHPQGSGLSEEKQIEEMAKHLRYTCEGECFRNEDGFIDCDVCRACDLYNAGYRKQSKGEWIVTDADSGSFGEYEPFIEFKCPKCESSYGIESGQYDWQYGEPIPWVACPLCGAKMKGESK